MPYTVPLAALVQFLVTCSADSEGEAYMIATQKMKKSHIAMLRTNLMTAVGAKRGGFSTSVRLSSRGSWAECFLAMRRDLMMEGILKQPRPKPLIYINSHRTRGHLQLQIMWNCTTLRNLAWHTSVRRIQTTHIAILASPSRRNHIPSRCTQIELASSSSPWHSVAETIYTRILDT